MAELAKVGPPRGSARNLPPLAESQNNLTTAHRHFVSRAALEQGRLARLASAAKIDSARDWLENASANMLYVGERLKPNFFWPIRINPLNKWGLSDFCDVVYWVQLQVLLHSVLGLTSIR